MNLILSRDESKPTGIFSTLTDESGNPVASTLEHAYSAGDGTWTPKIPPGEYTCVRGPHRLHGMTSDFETFEITGVSGHKDLLFHWGNYNKDSEGCVLLGQARVGDMVTNSRATFTAFMTLQAGVDSFQLSVNVVTRPSPQEV